MEISNYCNVYILVHVRMATEICRTFEL